jgi:hypothetical protein
MHQQFSNIILAATSSSDLSNSIGAGMKETFSSQELDKGKDVSRSQVAIF